MMLVGSPFRPSTTYLAIAHVEKKRRGGQEIGHQLRVEMRLGEVWVALRVTLAHLLIGTLALHREVRSVVLIYIAGLYGGDSKRQAEGRDRAVG